MDIKKTENILAFLFGNTATKRYTRIISLLILIVVSIMLIVNISFGFKGGKFYFDWKNVDVSIEKKL